MENSQSLTPTVKSSRRGKHKNPNYQRKYYRQNREKLLTYSKDYYGVKKLFSSHTYYNNILPSKTKNLFFLEEGSKKEKLERRLDKGRLRLATKDKRALKKYWNQPWFKEWLSKASLLSRYQEWSLRGGKRMGKKFLSFLDIDIEKSDLEEWRKRQLRKNAGLFLKYLNCFYVRTRKGFHVYILSRELLTNEILCHVDSWLKRNKIIGSIQSKGKYVVGFDSPNKKLVENGKWFWHVKGLEEVKETLAKFFLLVGKPEKKVAKPEKKSRQMLPQQQLTPQFKFSTQVKILSTSRKFFNRLGEVMRKVRYLNLVGKSGYFLLNTYQKPNILPSLSIGSVRNILLVGGLKHRFFSRMI